MERNVRLFWTAARWMGFAALCIVMLATAGSVSAKGKKYALFVGINDYPGVDHDLSGAVNDAKNMKALLESKFGYLPANTAILLDSQATRTNIFARLRAFGKLAGAGDVLVFQYSGHGSLIPDSWSTVRDETVKTEVNWVDENGDPQSIPSDFYDSAIVPWDADDASGGRAYRNFILDDELYDLFTPITQKGATVIFVSDSCHSGTIGKAADKVTAKIRFVPPTTILNVKSLSEVKAKPAGKPVPPRVVPGNYLALTAAKDNEFALDSADGTTPSGLFTTTLISVIRSSGKTPLTYKKLIDLVRPKVATTSTTVFNNDQHPQIDARFGLANLSLFAPAINK